MKHSSEKIISKCEWFDSKKMQQYFNVEIEEKAAVAACASDYFEKYNNIPEALKSNAKVDVAHGFNKSLAGTYKVTASGLNLRAGAGTGKSILAVMKNGEKVQCYGYYNDCNGVKWLYVVYKNIVGYASSKYLSK